MAIKIDNATTSPELVYDGFFLEELILSQTMNKDNTARPYYVLDIRYRMYAVLDNVRHYKNKTDTIKIENYAAVAYAKAISGDMDLANASAAIEQALTKIIIDQKPELGEATII